MTGFRTTTRAWYAASAIALAVSLTIAAPAATAQDQPADSTQIVETQRGPVRGVHREGVDVFLGIPYAAPPVGDLRWQPPAPPASWSEPLDANAFGNTCVQTNTLGVFAAASDTEDCLYLNIYAPRLEGRAGAGPQDRRPVMVWIHGGALFDGSSNEYDGSKLVREGDVVVVTINYRLNVFGFLAHPALDAEGDPDVNYGLMDQQFALRWVQQNIAAFGGDPDNVTIFGESAGGTAVLFNLVSPTAAGLFHRAIVHSPAYQPKQATRAAAIERGIAFAAALGCGADDSAQTAECLRSKPVREILAKAGDFVGQGPVRALDGKVLTLDMEEAFETGQFNQVPVVMGNNHDERTWFLGMTELAAGRPLSEQEVRAQLSAGPAGEQIAARYPIPAGANPSQVLAAERTDSSFACGTRRAIRLLSPHVPVWAYEFADQTAPYYFPPVSFEYGAAHTLEIQYLFEGHHGASGEAHPLNAAQRELSDVMTGYWTTFAAAGDPNLPAAPAWQRYDPGDDNYQSLQLPQPVRSLRVAADHQCAFWDSLAQAQAVAAGEDIDLSLAGNRFEPLAFAELDDAQKAMVQHILEGPRTRVSGPFNTLLRAPEMGDLAQALGAYIRYKSTLPAPLREMAIIMTGAHWKAEYEWYAHKSIALEAGLDPAIVDAIGAGRRPSGMRDDEAALYQFCDELLNQSRVSDDTFAAAKAIFGERGVVELTGTLGYYSLVSMILNVDEHPIPGGTVPQFGR